MATFFAGKKKLSKAAPQPQPAPLSKMSPTATTAPRSVEMPARPLPAVVPKQPQSNLERALTRQQYAPAQPQPAVVPAQRPQPYGPSMAEIQKQQAIQQQMLSSAVPNTMPQFTPQQLAELQKQNPNGFSQIQPYSPANSPSKPATPVSKQFPDAASYNNLQLQAMNAMKEARAAEENVKPKQPAMRKGGVVKKKPVAAAKKTTTAKYAKGGMVMSNCGASMKPQQKRKK